MILSAGAERVRAFQAAVAVGLGTGAVLPMLATRVSPLVAAGALAGMAIAAAAAIFPIVNLYLLAALTPLERFGRFTNDSSAMTFSLMRAAGFFAVAVVVLHAIFARKRLSIPDTVLWFAAYLFLGLVSLTWSTDYEFGINQCAMHLGTLLFLLVVVNIVGTLQQARFALMALLAATVVIAAFTAYKWNSSDEGIVQSNDYYNRGEGLQTSERFAVIIYDAPTMHLGKQRRAIGSTSHPGAYGLNLLLTLPFCIYFVRCSRGTTQVLLTLGILLLVGYNVVLTNTRAVLLTLVVTALLFQITGLLRIGIGSLAGLAVLGGIAFWFAPEDIKGRIYRFDNWFETGRDSSFGERLHLMRTAIQLFCTHPLFGMGMGNQVDIAKLADVDWRDRSRSAHNDVLTVVSESGLVGFACMTACLVTFYRRARFLERYGREMNDPRIQYLGTAARVQLGILLFFGLQSEPLSLPIKIFWLVVGIVVALSQSLAERAKVAAANDARLPAVVAS